MYRFAYLMFITCLLCHWLSCFMSATETGAFDRYFGVEVEVPTIRRYMAALYWSMTTLSTVGYGDIVPTSDGERAYAMLAMVIGGSLYGYIVGCMTSVITEVDVESRSHDDHMSMLSTWMDRQDKIPSLLRRRIRRH